VEDTDDNRGSHLDGVEESKRVRVQVPRRISSEGVNALVTFVVSTELLPRLLLLSCEIRGVDRLPDEVHR
jgi:hypothetical protein